MSIKDFDFCDDLKRYTTKERFWFENDKVKFWYRFYLKVVFHSLRPKSVDFKNVMHS